LYLKNRIIFFFYFFISFCLLFFSFHFLHISLFRFVFVDFVLLSLVSFYFVFISLISFRFVSFLLISFRFVSFLFRFALYRYPTTVCLETKRLFFKFCLSVLKASPTFWSIPTSLLLYVFVCLFSNICKFQKNVNRYIY
jgi:hypothetical protein